MTFKSAESSLGATFLTWRLIWFCIQKRRCHTFESFLRVAAAQRKFCANGTAQKLLLTQVVAFKRCSQKLFLGKLFAGLFSAYTKGKRSKISCIHRLRWKGKSSNKRICFRCLTYITPFVLLKLLARLPETRSSKQNAVGNLRSVYTGISTSCFNKCIIVQHAQRSFRSQVFLHKRY